MENRIEFLAAITALNKFGAIAGLINTNLNQHHGLQGMHFRRSARWPG